MSKIKNKDQLIAQIVEINNNSLLIPLAAKGSTIGFLFDTLRMSQEQIKKTIKLCNDKGYKTYVDPTVLDSQGNTLVYSKEWALHPTAQAQHLINLIENPNVKVIWSMHGSGGANLITQEIERIINSSLFSIERLIKFQQSMFDKVFMGAFSHHSYMAAWGADKFKAVVNATQIYHLAEFYEDATRDTTGREVTNKEKIAKSLVHNIDAPFEILNSSNHVAHKIGSYNKKAHSTPFLSGRIIGGNLGVELAEANKNTYKNKIVLIEEAFFNDMHAFHRAFEQAIDKAVIEKAQGIVIGTIRGREQEKINNAIVEVIERKCKDIPVYKTDNFGHGRYNLPLNFSNQVVIKEGVLFSSFYQDLTLNRSKQLESTNVRRITTCIDDLNTKRENSNLLKNDTSCQSQIHTSDIIDKTFSLINKVREKRFVEQVKKEQEFREREELLTAIIPGFAERVKKEKRELLGSIPSRL